jgi:hypothetical protein
MLGYVRRVAVLIAFTIAFVLVATASFAQDAASFKSQGDAAMDKLDFQVALENYNKAYGLSKDPALLYNRARALQSLNRMPEALDELERFDREAPADLKKRVPQLPQLLGEWRGRVGTISVKTAVGGARVIVDNKEIGRTPLPDRVRVNTGHVKIEVVAEGYEPFVLTTDITPAGITVEPTLVGKATVLVVHADPNATESLLDGSSGTGTPFERNVSAGKHVVVLKRSGYYDLSTETTIAAGERKVLDLKLEGKPVTAKWWFWTTIVVVAAAIVVPIVIAATTERSPDTGDISPGRVPAP